MARQVLLATRRGKYYLRSAGGMRDAPWRCFGLIDDLRPFKLDFVSSSHFQISIKARADIISTYVCSL